MENKAHALAAGIFVVAITALLVALAAALSISLLVEGVRWVLRRRAQPN